MDLSELGTYLFPGMYDLLRIEALDYYDAASDQGDYQRWRDGLPEQSNPGKTAWHDRLRADTANGITWRRLHVVTEPLTDYLLYEFEWGYIGNAAAGEDIRIAETSSQFEGIPELFVVNGGERVAISHYDEQGRFVEARQAAGGGPSGDVSWAAVADVLWRHATPFATWWAERPKHHNTRTRRAA